MKKTVVVFLGLTILKMCMSWAHAEEVSLQEQIIENIKKHHEQFTVYDSGEYPLGANAVLRNVMDMDGSEEKLLLQSIYGLETLKVQRQMEHKGAAYHFTAQYVLTVEQQKQLQKDIADWVHTYLPVEMPDRVKIALIAKHVCESTQYSTVISNNNGYKAYYNHYSACNGYSELVYYMCKEAGISVKMVPGITVSKGFDQEWIQGGVGADAFKRVEVYSLGLGNTRMHTWNMVKIEGEWYHLDTTWLDGNGDGSEGVEQPSTAYFLSADAYLKNSRVWDYKRFPVVIESIKNEKEVDNFALKLVGYMDVNSTYHSNEKRIELYEGDVIYPQTIEAEAPVMMLSLTSEIASTRQGNLYAYKTGNGSLGALYDHRAEVVQVSVGAPKLHVRLEGKLLTMDTEPIIVNGRTLVPLRGILEALQATVEYKEETGEIIVYKDSKKSVFKIGEALLKDGGRTVPLESAPIIYKNRTYVPLRVLAEQFNIQVDWNEKSLGVDLWARE